MNNRLLGSYYEDMACKYLESRGIEVLQRNYIYKGCEIDIIAREKDLIIFIEVKYRRDASFGFPLESISQNKIVRIRRAATGYIHMYRIKNYYIRFDCISFIGRDMDWIKDAF